MAGRHSHTFSGHLPWTLHRACPICVCLMPPVCLSRRTHLKDKSWPIPCPDPACSCSLDPQQDICPIFATRKELKEYSQLLDVAAVCCVPEKDRFYCPNATCSALYQLTNNRSVIELSFHCTPFWKALMLCSAVNILLSCLSDAVACAYSWARLKKKSRYVYVPMRCCKGQTF